MKHIVLRSRRLASAVVTGAVATALVVTAPAALADDTTGTPSTPGTSTTATTTAGPGGSATSTTSTSATSSTTGAPSGPGGSVTPSTAAPTTPTDASSSTPAGSPATTEPEAPATSVATATVAAPPRSTTSSTSPSTSSTSSTTTRLSAAAAPVPVVSASSDVWKVKDLQVRLRLVRSTYWPYAISGVYGWTLGQKVLAFQTDQGLAKTGVVDAATWTRLVALTRTPTVVSPTSGVWKVKDLQARLKVVKASYWEYAVSGTYGWTLGQRVLTFQRDRDLPQSGVVDSRTWARLLALSASPVALATSAPASNVKELQLRLRARGLWSYAISGVYGWTLGQQVLAFQRAAALPQSGVVDARTWARLRALTYTPGAFDQHRYYAGLRPLMPTIGSLDYRCRTGRTMCVDKATRTLTWVVDGKPLMVMWARFGRPGAETREGTFHVDRMYEYVISNLYFTPMPYSMFFSGGQAVHYSSNFARLGYASASHGCVNIGDYDQVKALYFKVRVGDKVVVYH